MQTLPRGDVLFQCVVHPGQALKKRNYHFQQRPSAWDLFSRSNAVHAPVPVTPVSIHSSYTHFTSTNRHLHGVTAFGQKHACRNSSHTCGVITNIHWSRRCVPPLGKRDHHRKNTRFQLAVDITQAFQAQITALNFKG